MKKLLTLLLASAMLLSALPAAFAEESDGGPVLADASPFVINEETGYIENIPEFITARELRNHFCDKDKVTVTAADGSALKLDDLVGTDAFVTVGGKSVKALVHGDVNRDAKITTNDAVAILRHLASMKVDIAADAAENEDSTVSMYFDSIMNRISETDTVGSGDLTYTVRTAKNEIEDVQILLSSTEDKTGLTLEVGDIVNQNGDVIPMEVRYGHYYEFGIIDTDGDRFVDPYIKLEGSFDLPANLSRSFLIKVKTTIDAEAGLYKTTVNVRDAEGRIIKTGTVRVYVWDFALDEETACDTAFCLGGLLGTDEYVSGYDYMLENRISAYAIPYNVLDDRADAYSTIPA